MKQVNHAKWLLRPALTAQLLIIGCSEVHNVRPSAPITTYALSMSATINGLQWIADGASTFGTIHDDDCWGCVDTKHAHGSSGSTSLDLFFPDIIGDRAYAGPMDCDADVRFGGLHYYYSGSMSFRSRDPDQDSVLMQIGKFSFTLRNDANVQDSLNLDNGYFSVIGVRQNETGSDDQNDVTDADGNNYHTVKIGSQVWMAKNLMTTKYRNGDAIANVTDNWADLRTAAYCNYDNDDLNVFTYGRLYNRYAILDARNLAPPGWHVARDADWSTLIAYLGGDSAAGGKLKEASEDHWFIDVGSTDEAGFSARPGGIRGSAGFFYLGASGFWWSIPAGGGSYGREIDYNSAAIHRATLGAAAGVSVRCVKD